MTSSEVRTPTRSTGYLPTLDGWRAVAVSMVIFSHISHPDTVGNAHDRFGPFGVNIFFGISGLLICSRLLDEVTLRGHISLRGFYIRRTFRILPPAWAYIAALAALAAADLVPVRNYEYPACLLFYRNYLPNSGEFSGTWYTKHFWSLAVEEHFYLMFPGLLILLGARRAVVVIPGLAVGIAVWRIIDARHQIFLPGYDIVGRFRTDTRLDALLWGCWVSLLLRTEGIGRRLWAIRFAGLVGLLVVIDMASDARVVNTYIRAMFVPGLFIPFMLAATVITPGNPISRLLEWPPLRWVGRLSYSLYLWQELFFTLNEGHRSAGLGLLQVWPYNLVPLAVAAAASYYLIERPMIRLGHRLAKPVTAGRG